MIHIEQNQQLKDDPRIRVVAPTGDYNETDLIECYEDGQDPSIPKFMYQAQYVVLGNCVYQQSDEITEDQVAALLANKPIHEVINNRKLIDGKKPAAKYIGKIIGRKGLIGKRNLRGDVVLDETVPVVDEKPVKPVKPVKQQDVITESNQQSTTTPPTPSTPHTQSTTTPEFLQSASSTPSIDANMSTTTPPVIDTNTSTTTPPYIDSGPIETDISTTTAIDSTGSEVVNNVSTTTEQVSETMQSNVENTATVIESIMDTNKSTTTPSVVDEVVSYAKKRIVRKLRL